MGQAKSRGSQDARVAAAVARQQALKPVEMICNDCKAIIKGEHIHLHDTRNMVGMEMACTGACPECKSITWGFKGTEEAVLAISELLAAENPGAIGATQPYVK